MENVDHPAAFAAGSACRGGIDVGRLRDDPQPAHRMALTVAGAFVCVGLAWVVLTDIVLYHAIHDRVLIARLETMKGWAFVGLAGSFLYVVTLRSASRLARVWRLTAAVVESIADGVLVLGRERTITHANPAAVRMLGCGLDRLIGMDAEEFSRRFHVSYLDGSVVPPEAYISQRVFDEGGRLHYKVKLQPLGGGDLVISATAAGVRSSPDEPTLCVVSVMHDITDSENLVRLRDQLFTGAAHCLKTPVAVIKANAQALLRTVGPRHRGVVSALNRQCDRIDRLVQNLMVLARARSRSLELHPEPVDLEQLVERIAGEPLWSHRHEVVVDALGRAPCVRADEERIALILRNVLYEACRLSPAQSRVLVYTKLEGNWGEVGVRYRPLPWHEQATAVYNEYDDVGIGRSVTDTIVKAHGGSSHTVVAGSHVTIYFQLPAQRGEQP
jgi:two-component system, NtrC family, sensor histidine kinase KinB